MTREMRNPSIAGLRILAVVAIVLLSAVAARAADDAPATLVTALVYGTHLPGLGTPAVALAKTVKTRSDGVLELDLKQPGEGPKPHEILKAVSDGKVDAGFTTAGFWASEIPAAPLFGGFPFGPDANGYLAWFDRGNGRKLYQEMYDQAGFKVHVIPCAFGGGEAGGWFAKEITAKKDLEGLRMRIFGLGARVMSRVGVVPVLVPGGALPKAFDKGEIDAAELYTPAVDREQDLQEATKIVYMPGWHQPETVLELLINKDRWNALGSEKQKLLKEACSDMLQSSLAESASLQASALAGMSAKDSVRVLDWPDEVLEAFRAAWGEIAKEESARDYLFKEVFEDIETFRAKATGATAVSTAPAPKSGEPKSGP